MEEKEEATARELLDKRVSEWQAMMKEEVKIEINPVVVKLPPPPSEV